MKEDSKAVYYLCGNNSNVTIIYCYIRTRVDALASLRKLVAIDQYEQCLYNDDKGRDVLLFEQPALIPRSYKTLTYFNEKYSRLLSQYCKDKKIQFDAVIVHFPSRFSEFANLIESKNKIAILHSFDISSDTRISYIKSIETIFSKFGCRSAAILEIAKKQFKAEVFLCPSGVPSSLVIDSDWYRAWKPDGILRVSCVSRLVPYKNVANLITSFSLLNSRKWYLSIIGDGPERDRLIALVKQLNIEKQVDFAGGVEREEVFDRLRHSDVFALVSKKETLGLAYLEAMACGALIVASSGRGIDGMFPATDGIRFVNPDDIDGITDALEHFLSMQESDAIKLRLGIKTIIANLTEEAVSTRYFGEAVN